MEEITDMLAEGLEKITLIGEYKELGDHLNSCEQCMKAFEFLLELDGVIQMKSGKIVTEEELTPHLIDAAAMLIAKNGLQFVEVGFAH